MIHNVSKPKKSEKESKLVIYLTEDYQHSPAFLRFQQTFIQKDALDFTLIQRIWPRMTYLPVIDQVLIDLPRKQRNNLSHIETLLQLPPSLLKSDSTALTMNERILLQLLRALLQQKQQFIFEDVFDELSISEIQEMMPLLKKLTTTCQVEVLIFTKNRTLAASPYADKVIHEE